MSYIEQFKNAMRDHGIEPPGNIIPDGNLHRFDAHKKGAGWYSLHSGDYWAGGFGDWSLDIKSEWRQDSPVRTVITAQQRADWDKRKKQAEAEKAKLAEYASRRASHIFEKAHKEYRHQYCDIKGIRIDDDLNVKVSDGVLLIPIYNSNFHIVNLQSILGDGTKKFQYGAEIKGCFGCVDTDHKCMDTLYIAEGWATAVSVYNHFKKPCFVAFSAGNLKPVAINLRAIYPDVQIIIAADNDFSGVGEKAAIEAAKACGGSYIIPDVVGYDFCDLFGG